ncbi:MAG: NAD(P)/FAD-dependent oxidoreductase [Bacilli bacterium]|nr:NAD(P)/FAD-dependent oxidoreductase [Bacilli bacterium]
MIRVRQIKININNNTIDEIIYKTASKLKINKNDISSIEVVKKSIDARDKENINYIYEVEIDVKNEKKILDNNKSNDIYLKEDETYNFDIKNKGNMKNRPIIVGSGPSGLFCAYMLSEYGYKPIIIERGEKVEDRVKTIEKFWKTGKLNKNSNVQFGEGGAGTFSDGKLNTLVRDKNFRMKKVFEIFVECGAPKEILYENKPHIGTDLLRNVIINMRNKITAMGGYFRYNTLLTNLVIENNTIKQIEVNNDELIPCDNLVIAIGHSARDTFKMLHENGLDMMSKPFAVGVRIQHTQEMINKSQYGSFSKLLPPSDYKLTYTAKDKRGVYSFCMCPGGYVVNASSEEGNLVINGMSNYKRDSKVSNSALIVQVSNKDFGDNLFDGMQFQIKLEKLAYEEGKGLIPVQLYKDFKENILSTNFKTVKPEFKGGYNFSNINNILPKFICNDLIEAIEYFNTKIKGYNNDDVIISGVETRTSSPIRILRGDNYMSNIKGIYPIGEGAGYAGGITTSAMDGIRCFEKIICNIK